MPIQHEQEQPEDEKARKRCQRKEICTTVGPSDVKAYFFTHLSQVAKTDNRMTKEPCFSLNVEEGDEVFGLPFLALVVFVCHASIPFFFYSRV